MKKIIDGLKSKWLKDTGRTAILIAIVIVIFLGMNVLVQRLNLNDIDLTPEGLYSLTDESKGKISNLPAEDKFNIYMFDYKDNDPIVELAKQYSKINENIKVEVLQVEDRPDLVSKYNIEKGYGTVILTSGSKYKTYSYNNFHSYDYSTQKYTDLTEQRLTNGIIGVSSIGKNIPIYVLTGHGEMTMTSEMIYLNTALELENYDMRTLNILSEQKVPEDCACLIIASPERDFTDFEANAIHTYINNGGSILWFNDPYSANVETPNMKSILDTFGVTIRQDGVVYEQEKAKMAMGAPNCIFPTIENTQMTNGIKEVLLLAAGKLEFVGQEELSGLAVSKTDILTTSDKSFFRTNIQDTDYTPKDGETEGTNVVAASLEKVNQYTGKTSKLVVFANNAFVTDQPIYAGNSAYLACAISDNKNIVLKTIEYVADVEEGLTIRKDIETTYYTPTETQDIIIRVIIFSLPIIVIILGIIIWSLRRRKK